MSRYIVFSIFLIAWMCMWWWTYVYHIKGCGAQERNELGFKLESSSPLPLSFQWSDPTPIISDDFVQWRDSIVGSLKTDQILEVTGIAYRDEASGTEEVSDLSAQRAQAISRLFIPGLASERIVEHSGVGEITADIKDRNFPAYQVRAFVRNESIRELTDCTLVYFPYDSSSFATNDFINRYIEQLRDHLTATGQSVSLLTLYSQEAPQDSVYRMALKRRTLLKDLMILSGIPVERVLLSGDRNLVSSSCMQEDVEVDAWIAMIEIK